MRGAAHALGSSTHLKLAVCSVLRLPASPLPSHFAMRPAPRVAWRRFGGAELADRQPASPMTAAHTVVLLGTAERPYQRHAREDEGAVQ